MKALHCIALHCIRTRFQLIWRQIASLPYTSIVNTSLYSVYLVRSDSGFFESSPLVPNCVYCSRLFAPDSFEIHAPGPPYIIRVRRNIRNRSLHRQWHRCTSMVIRQITRITPFFKIHVIIYESTPCEWTFGKISLVFSNFTRFAREIRQKLREIYSQSPLTRSWLVVKIIKSNCCE